MFLSEFMLICTLAYHFCLFQRNIRQSVFKIPSVASGDEQVQILIQAIAM